MSTILTDDVVVALGASIKVKDGVGGNACDEIMIASVGEVNSEFRAQRLSSSYRFSMLHILLHSL